jgi:Hypoxia induced protein conserved region
MREGKRAQRAWPALQPLLAGQRSGAQDRADLLVRRGWPKREAIFGHGERGRLGVDIAGDRPLAPTDRSAHISRMTAFLTILLVLAMLGTLTVLGFGVATLLRGGDPRRSNKLMQSRVIMQALALVLLAMLMLLARH